MKKLIFGAILTGGIIAGYASLTSMSTAAPKAVRQEVWIKKNGETVYEPCPTQYGNQQCPGY